MKAVRGPLLLIEGDPDLTDVLAEVLEAEGHAVVRTAHVAEALEWLARGQRPALVLLDLLMPRMEGLAFLERLRASPEHADLPVVALSTAPVKHPCVVALLRKPFEMTLLAATVRRVLDTP